MKKLMILSTLGSAAFGVATALASEPPHNCFPSIAEAAAQTHAVDPENVRSETLGFRLQERRHDRMLNKTWATVRNCAHPERPAVTVETREDSDAEQAWQREKAQAEMTPPASAPAQVMRAGTLIRLLWMESNLRFETTAVAQSNGAIGERVRVRLVRSVENEGQAAMFLSGTVRSAEVIEVENQR